LPVAKAMVTMRSLTRYRAIVLLLLIATLIASGWLYWNRVPASDLAVWGPADSMAYIEVNNLGALVEGVQQTVAWKSLGPLLGAPDRLAPNRWAVRLARWTGIGSPDAILFARSQIAVVLSGAEGSQSGSTLIIKPLLTLIVETHTSQRRMRAAVEEHLEETARRDFGNPVVVRKQVAGVDLEEWQSEDGARRIVASFINTTVVIGNDEAAVLHSVEAGTGRRAGLHNQTEFEQTRRAVDPASSAIFGFISQAGVKSLLQAYALNNQSRGTVSSDAITGARLFADTFGAIVKQVGWTARFTNGAVEDHCSVILADGVTDNLRISMSPDHGPDLTQLPFAPPGVQSVSVYSFHDSAGVWNDLNAVVSSHADLLGAIAARPVMRSLLSAYGISDADSFARGIGTHLQTVRGEEGSPAVLIGEVFDRPAIEKAFAARFGKNPKTEKFAAADLIIAPDNWTAAFVQNNFLLGPGEDVRHCLQAYANGQSISSTRPFREAQRFVDVSLPLTSVTFTDDSRAAVSFVDAFSHESRSAFSTNAAAISEATSALPLAMSALIVKEGRFEWISRSSFGIGGAVATDLLPEK
jgi:hypothetical protein